MTKSTDRFPRDWRVAVYIVAATVAALGWGEVRVAHAAAREAASAIGPVEQKLDRHLERVSGAADYMRSYASWSQAALLALCRSAPRAECPDPPVWPGPTTK